MAHDSQVPGLGRQGFLIYGEEDSVVRRAEEA